MIPRVFLFATAFVLLVMQAVLGRTMAIGTAAPDFYLLFVVYLVGAVSPSRALIAACALGLLRDGWTPAPLGSDAAALLVVAGVLVWAHRRFVLDTDIALALSALLAGLVHGGVWMVAMAAADSGAEARILFGHIVLPVALYNAALMPLFARVMAWVMRRLPGGARVRLA